MTGWNSFTVAVCGLLFSVAFLRQDAPAIAAEHSVALNSDNYDSACGIDISQQDSLIHVSWPLDRKSRGRLILNPASNQPLIHSIATTFEKDIVHRNNSSAKTISSDSFIQSSRLF